MIPPVLRCLRPSWICPLTQIHEQRDVSFFLTFDVRLSSVQPGLLLLISQRNTFTRVSHSTYNHKQGRWSMWRLRYHAQVMWSEWLNHRCNGLEMQLCCVTLSWHERARLWVTITTMTIVSAIWLAFAARPAESIAAKITTTISKEQIKKLTKSESPEQDKTGSFLPVKNCRIYPPVSSSTIETKLTKKQVCRITHSWSGCDFHRTSVCLFWNIHKFLKTWTHLDRLRCGFENNLDKSEFRIKVVRIKRDPPVFWNYVGRSVLSLWYTFRTWSHVHW